MLFQSLVILGLYSRILVSDRSRKPKQQRAYRYGEHKGPVVRRQNSDNSKFFKIKIKNQVSFSFAQMHFL